MLKLEWDFAVYVETEERKSEGTGVRAARSALPREATERAAEEQFAADAIELQFCGAVDYDAASPLSPRRRACEP